MIRALRIAAAWTVLGLAGALLFAVLGTRPFGYQTLTVMSGSMEPAIATGDVVIDETIAPLRARVGDVVTFTDPLDPGRLITHRVHSVRATPDGVAFVTKGDANDATEDWTVPRHGTIGVVRYRIPVLGYLLVWLRAPWARIALLVIPAIALGAIEIWRIWRPAAALSEETADAVAT